MNDHLTYAVEGGLLRIRTEGNYSVEAFLNLIVEAFKAPETPSQSAVLIDARGAGVERSEKEYYRIMETMVAHADRMLCLAYVTRSEKVNDVIKRAAAFAQFNRLGDVMHFSEIEPARKWIAEKLD